MGSNGDGLTEFPGNSDVIASGLEQPGQRQTGRPIRRGRPLKANKDHVEVAGPAGDGVAAGTAPRFKTDVRSSRTRGASAADSGFAPLLPLPVIHPGMLPSAAAGGILTTALLSHLHQQLQQHSQQQLQQQQYSQQLQQLQQLALAQLAQLPGATALNGLSLSATNTAAPLTTGLVAGLAAPSAPFLAVPASAEPAAAPSGFIPVAAAASQATQHQPAPPANPSAATAPTGVYTAMLQTDAAAFAPPSDGAEEHMQSAGEQVVGDTQQEVLEDEDESYEGEPNSDDEVDEMRKRIFDVAAQLHSGLDHDARVITTSEMVQEVLQKSNLLSSRYGQPHSERVVISLIQKAREHVQQTGACVLPRPVQLVYGDKVVATATLLQYGGLYHNRKVELATAQLVNPKVLAPEASHIKLSMADPQADPPLITGHTSVADIQQSWLFCVDRACVVEMGWKPPAVGTASGSGGVQQHAGQKAHQGQQKKTQQPQRKRSRQEHEQGGSGADAQHPAANDPDGAGAARAGGRPSCPECSLTVQPAQKKCKCGFDLRSHFQEKKRQSVRPIDPEKARVQLHECCERLTGGCSMNLVVLEFHPDCCKKQVQCKAYGEIGESFANVADMKAVAASWKTTGEGWLKARQERVQKAGAAKALPRTAFATVDQVLEAVELGEGAKARLRKAAVLKVSDLASLSRDELQEIGFAFMEAKKIVELLHGKAA